MTYQTYARYNPNRANHWQDWANLILAIWLFFSPWILQFGSNLTAVDAPATSATLNAVAGAAWNAWVVAIVVFLVALSAIGRMELWQEWANLLLGAWLFIAPWVLGFALGSYPAAAWDHWIVGALIFLIAASNMMGYSNGPLSGTHPRETLR